MINSKRTLVQFLRDEEGSYIVEYTIIMPVFLIMLFGAFDLAYGQYSKSVLQGAALAAARSAALESGASATVAIDAKVEAAVKNINPNAVFTKSRKNFDGYNDINDKPEDFTDGNKNGRYDTGECFIDVNGNKTWDEKRSGKDGQGGSDDVVVYSASVAFDPIFPFWGMLGKADMKYNINVKTVLKNQPYGDQAKAQSVCL